MSKLSKYAFAQGSSDQQMVISEFGVVDKNTATDEMVEKIQASYPWYAHHFVKANDKNAESGFNAEKATKAELVAEVERLTKELSSVKGSIQPLPSEAQSSATVAAQQGELQIADQNELQPTPENEPETVAKATKAKGK